MAESTNDSISGDSRSDTDSGSLTDTNTHCTRIRRANIKLGLFPYRTRVCHLLDVEYPVLLAGMGFVSRARLVAAVSEAGGFGVIGAGSMSAKDLEEQIALVRAETDKPFGVDLWQTDPPRAPGQLEVVLAAKPAALVWFCPDRTIAPRSVDVVHGAGIRVLSLVRTATEARAHVDAGVDAVIATGAEGGGHTVDRRLGTMALVPQVVDAVDVPVVAGGGIYDGRGLAAALALGACGAWIGTRFINAAEAPVHEGYQDAIIAARDEDTTITRAYSGLPARVLRNEFTDEWASREHEVKPFGEQKHVAGAAVTSGVYEGDRARGQMPAGAIAGAIRDVRPAAKIMQDILEEAARTLQKGVLER